MSRARKFSDAELTALHGQGQSDHEIAAALGASRNTVRVRRQRLGLPTHYNPHADRPARRIATPRPASHIVVTGSGKTDRSKYYSIARRARANAWQRYINPQGDPTR